MRQKIFAYSAKKVFCTTRLDLKLLNIEVIAPASKFIFQYVTFVEVSKQEVNNYEKTSAQWLSSARKSMDC